MSHDRHTLAARIGALREHLSLAGAALASPAIREDLRDRVDVLFGGMLERKDHELKALSDDLGSTERPGRKAVRDAWSDFEQHTAECDRLLKEYRAFVEGALYRSAGLDQGLCDIADALLRQLSTLTDVPWTRFTILADGEFFAPMTDIIRLRYPDFTIWNLPVLAHEFGHFVTPRLLDRLRGTDPLGRLRIRIGEQVGAGAGSECAVKALQHLDEFIGDAFAVYTTGPAFVASCLLLRFEPLHAWEEDAEHPSDGCRAYLQLKMLGEMTPAYGKVRQFLTATWQECLAAAEVKAMADADEWLDVIVPELIGLFRRLAPKAALTEDDWLRASDLSTRLTAANGGPIPLGLTIRDVLNAAWLSRLSSSAGTRAAGARALQIARDMVKE